MSSSHPPASAFRDARRRNQRGREARMPAVITLDGAEYRGAARVMAARPELRPGGFQQVQRFIAWIPKGLLTAAPTVKTACVIHGLGFRVDEIGGQNAGDTEWVIRGQRTPGRDA